MNKRQLLWDRWPMRICELVFYQLRQRVLIYDWQVLSIIIKCNCRTETDKISSTPHLPITTRTILNVDRLFLCHWPITHKIESKHVDVVVCVLRSSTSKMHSRSVDRKGSSLSVVRNNGKSNWRVHVVLPRKGITVTIKYNPQHLRIEDQLQRCTIIDRELSSCREPPG